MQLAGMRWIAVLLLSFASQSRLIGAAKILAIFPFQSRSHLIMGSALTKELVNRGHEVTMISHFPEKEKIANYTDIQVKTTMMDVLGAQGHANQFFKDRNSGIVKAFNTAKRMFTVSQVTCGMMLQEEGVRKLIHDKDAHFDLIIMEAFLNDCFLGFVHKFKAPLVQVCSFSGSHYMDDWFGNPHPFSYIPEFFLTYTDKMNFWERTLNSVVGTAIRLTWHYIYLPSMGAVLREHFEFLEDLPPIAELEQNTSVLLLNTHFSVSYPRPLMPGMIEVGGMHVKPAKELPKDLQKYLDDAPEGVVYFSMGSNLRSTELPESKRNALLEAFSQLKQKVLWKWENDTLPGQPSNVKLGKWLPQSDILAHPNVRVFITHGGLLSTQEAMLRGVPVVGIPIFGDQTNNMKKAQASGFGVTLDFENLTTESAKSAILEVLENPRYAENARRVSERLRDQPLTPLESAVFWTEYVMRHKGAPHMRSAARDLAWYQYFLLDVIAVITIAVGLFILFAFIVLRALVRLCFRRNKISDKKKRN